MLKTLLAGLFLLSSLLFAEESVPETLPSGVRSKLFISELNVTQLTLQNGLKVCLKPTDFETDEILLRLVAPGGFSLLPPKHRAAGEIAAQVAWESGQESVTSDQLSVLLYDHAIDFNLKIQPFSRMIDATVDSENLPVLLKLVKEFFTQQKFTKEAFNTIVKETKESLSKKATDRDTSFEDAFKMLNTQNYSYLKSLCESDLVQADYNASKEFFEFAFSDPEKFTAVIIGNFSLETDLPAIIEHLNAIPRKNQETVFSQAALPTFPKGEIIHKVTLAGRSESLARLTFPLRSVLDRKHSHPFEIAIQILELRLRETLRQKMKTSFSVSVSYEFPLHPVMELPWMTIQYRTPTKNVMSIKSILLGEIEQLRTNGPSQAEVDRVLQNIKRSDEFWLKENTYWLETLSNYYMWDWDPKGAIKTYDSVAGLTPIQIKELFNKMIEINNYTLLYSTP